MPTSRPFLTRFVCWPSKVPSNKTSAHQQANATIKIFKPLFNTTGPLQKSCIVNTPPKVIIKAAIAVNNGQGLGSTK